MKKLHGPEKIAARSVTFITDKARSRKACSFSKRVCAQK
jgi:hypothetical protein